jgi:hypothetical protein
MLYMLPANDSEHQRLNPVMTPALAILAAKEAHPQPPAIRAFCTEPLKSSSRLVLEREDGTGGRFGTILAIAGRKHFTARSSLRCGPAQLWK